MIEPSVDYPVLAHRIGNRPEIPSGVAVLERLREMPHLSGNCELSKRMRDGERLSELCSTNLILDLLGNYSVHIKVESVYIITYKE
jgi:hypothetical protein